jgi:hypothetical protein
MRQDNRNQAPQDQDDDMTGQTNYDPTNQDDLNEEGRGQKGGQTGMDDDEFIGGA